MNLDEYNHNARQYKKIQQKQNQLPDDQIKSKVVDDEDSEEKKAQRKITLDARIGNAILELPTTWKVCQTLQPNVEPSKNQYFRNMVTAWNYSGSKATDTALATMLGYAKQGQFNLNYLTSSISRDDIMNDKLWKLPPATICHILALHNDRHYSDRHDMIIMSDEGNRYLEYDDVINDLDKAPAIIAQAIKNGKTIQVDGGDDEIDSLIRRVGRLSRADKSKFLQALEDSINK